MTERPPQYGLEPQACPFIALDEDRDRRLDVPDARHRCYAEPVPQPRAEAHQRAYCLTPAFAACPIFLDWAARASADPIATRRTVPTPAQLARPGDDSPAARPTDPGQRAWAAPPPWTGEGALQPRPTPASEQLGAFAEPSDPPDRDLSLGGISSDTAAALAAARAPVPSASAPEAGVPAEALAALEAPEAPAVFPMDDEVPGFLAGRDRATDAPSADLATVSAGTLRPTLSPSLAALSAPQDESAVPTASPRFTSQAKPAPPNRPGSGGEWSGQRRYEGYSMARTKVGWQQAPGIIVAFIGVLITVLAIYLVMGVQGSGSVGPDATRDRGGSPTPFVSPTPTPSPSPSPVTYTVKSGDSLFTIAKHYGITVDQIACFNAITDPNILQVGQVLAIPEDTYACPGASASASPSAGSSSSAP